MIQRPPACQRHADALPGKANIVPESDCPWCWQEAKEEAPTSAASAADDCDCIPGVPHKQGSKS